MNITGIKYHKIHILHIKKQFVNLLQKNKKEKSNKRELERQKKQKIRKKKLQIYWISRKDMRMHRNINLKYLIEV